MNLKHLVEVQQALMAERGAEAENLCRQAYYCIAEAEAQGFNDKSLLKQAMQLFSQALRQQPGYTDACLGLAYLAILLEQQALASRYLHLVLSVAPEHPEALNLLDFVLQDAADPTLENRMSLNHDQLYDQLDHAIFAFQRYWSRYSALQVDERASCRKQLQELKAQLTAELQQFEIQLDLLETEFETHTFRRRLRMGEALSEQFDQALVRSAEMEATLKSLQALHQELRGVHLAIAAQKSDQEAVLEQIHDRLERLQHQLQRFAEIGAQTANLVYAHDIALALLDQAHENLDTR